MIRRLHKLLTYDIQTPAKSKLKIPKDVLGYPLTFMHQDIPNDMFSYQVDIGKVYKRYILYFKGIRLILSS